MNLLPLELQYLIFSTISLPLARLIHKSLSLAFNPQFIKSMTRITDKHKIEYINTGKNMICYNTIPSKYVYDYYANYTYGNNIKLQCDNDLFSIYNILKLRDYYQQDFARNTILKQLGVHKLWIYNEVSSYIQSLHIYLTTNAYMLGIHKELNVNTNIGSYSWDEYKQTQLKKYTII